MHEQNAPAESRDTLKVRRRTRIWRCIVCCGFWNVHKTCSRALLWKDGQWCQRFLHALLWKQFCSSWPYEARVPASCYTRWTSLLLLFQDIDDAGPRSLCTSLPYAISIKSNSQVYIQPARRAVLQTGTSPKKLQPQWRMMQKMNEWCECVRGEERESSFQTVWPTFVYCLEPQTGWGNEQQHKVSTGAARDRS